MIILQEALLRFIKLGDGVSALALADLLEEEGDWRAEVVRRHALVMVTTKSPMLLMINKSLIRMEMERKEKKK